MLEPIKQFFQGWLQMKWRSCAPYQEPLFWAQYGPIKSELRYFRYCGQSCCTSVN